MDDAAFNTESVAADQLKAFIERIERLEEEKAGIAVFLEAADYLAVHAELPHWAFRICFSFVEEIQRPILTRITNRLSKSKKLPKLEEKGVRLQIITGLEAIGRGQDLTRLDAALTGLSKFVAPEELSLYIKKEKLIEKYLIAHGVDTKDTMNSPEEIAAIQQSQQQQQMIQQVAPEGVKQLGGIAQTNLKLQSGGRPS